MRWVEGGDGDAVELPRHHVVVVQVLVAPAFGLEGVSSANQQRVVGNLQDYPDVVVALLLRKGKKTVVS